jgi:uncharacterized membrane protein YfcA
MMTFAIIAASFLASFLTLFSGFGLGTILMPVAAIFFPVAVAVTLTAFVHLLNNFFKVAMLWRHIERGIVVRFGLPAMIAAVPGALLLGVLTKLPVIHNYNVGDVNAVITPVKLTVGLLLIVFATAEWRPVFKNLKLPSSAFPIGGLLSGFFGGLSGHQGAFRSAFLIHANLNKEQFVASNAAIASLVDVARLAVYGLNVKLIAEQVDVWLLAGATMAAFAGAMAGTVSLKKVTIGFIQKLVAGMLYVLGILLVFGLI